VQTVFIGQGVLRNSLTSKVRASKNRTIIFSFPSTITKSSVWGKPNYFKWAFGGFTTIAWSRLLAIGANNVVQHLRNALLFINVEQSTYGKGYNNWSTFLLHCGVTRQFNWLFKIMEWGLKETLVSGSLTFIRSFWNPLPHSR